MPFHVPRPALIQAFAATASLLCLHVPLQAANAAATATVIGPIARSVGSGETMGCETITLGAADVARYFAAATPVPFHVFHYESIVLPCSFSGRLLRGGKTYQWSIHAGGAGYLQSDDGRQNLLYLCRAACEKAVPAIVGF